MSAIINYRIVDPKKALFNIADYKQFVRINAQSVLKHVVGHHTYDELKSNADEVNAKLVSEIQPIVDCCGVEISSMSLNELNYAPEIAGAMLKKQAAGALVEARQLIVAGAVMISQEAIKQMEETGVVQMSNDGKQLMPAQPCLYAHSHVLTCFDCFRQTK